MNLSMHILLKVIKVWLWCRISGNAYQYAVWRLQNEPIWFYNNVNCVNTQTVSYLIFGTGVSLGTGFPLTGSGTGCVMAISGVLWRSSPTAVASVASSASSTKAAPTSDRRLRTEPCRLQHSCFPFSDNLSFNNCHWK